ncbi:MAG: succinate dehydrogenase/fumarate reductase iron-sulfur subunit [Thermoflexales bacterium]|nr:succinate dehydrogenase/fumarate reductase iron-sulfur subunit [Thermoflexales bacterium]
MKLTVKMYRYKPGSEPHYDTFPVEVPDAGNILDAVEQAWAADKTVMFRHACHHASCGSCGLLVNDVEKLPCVTPVKDYGEGATIKIDPMRNFPVITDIAVDASPIYQRMTLVGMPIIRKAESLRSDGKYVFPEGLPDFGRFENCLECGLCLSACPVMATDPEFLGPMGLAAAERLLNEPRGVDKEAIYKLIDDEHGLWRCHSSFECTEACPYEVDPGAAIMRLKGKVAARKIGRLFGKN